MNAERLSGSPAVAATGDTKQDPQTLNKAQVVKLAAEFESLLLSNIFKDMRAAGRWSEEDSGDMLGASAFNQTFDSELARTLSQSGGFGLSSFLQQALQKYAPDAAATAMSAGTASTLAPATATAASAAEPAITQPASLVSTARALVNSKASTAPLPIDADRGSLPGVDELHRPTAKLTSAFGWRTDPLTGAAKFHRGVDLKAAEGDAVAAAGAGTVVFSGRNGGYGNSVVIEHANGVRTRYAHLQAPLVNVGDTVAEGQSIGRAGHTGRATGTHVHYEVLEQGKAVDPLR